jgi:hydroxymethylpyrimidine/phosphomethylpyrimidine kinase
MTLGARTHGASAGDAPIVVAIGGLDSSGGSGLVRDFLTAHTLGARVVLVPTAWTIQPSEGSAVKISLRPADDARQDVLSVLAGLPAAGVAVKVGMLGSPALTAAVLAALRGYSGPLVMDPVLATSTGHRLFNGQPDDLAPLLARATLVTPNIGEAAALANQMVSDTETARRAAEQLRQRGAGAVLVKGGHLAGEAADLLLDAEGAITLTAPRVPGKDPRGTGCALATAIATHLARGHPLREAVAIAKQWLHERIAAAVERDGAHWL